MASRKDALRDKLDAEIKKARLEIERLEAKGKEARADARLEIDDYIRKLKEKRNDAKAKLDDVKNSAGQALEDIQTGAEHAWRTLADATGKAADRFD